MTGDKVEITLTLEEAEQLRLNLCDVLCWMRGFEAAFIAAEEHDRPKLPPSIWEIRNFNADLARLLRDAGGAA